MASSPASFLLLVIPVSESWAPSQGVIQHQGPPSTANGHGGVYRRFTLCILQTHLKQAFFWLPLHTQALTSPPWPGVATQKGHADSELAKQPGSARNEVCHALLQVVTCSTVFSYFFFLSHRVRGPLLCATSYKYCLSGDCLSGGGGGGRLGQVRHSEYEVTGLCLSTLNF